jgi:hypothetical protein
MSNPIHNVCQDTVTRLGVVHAESAKALPIQFKSFDRWLDHIGEPASIRITEAHCNEDLWSELSPPIRSKESVRVHGCSTLTASNKIDGFCGYYYRQRPAARRGPNLKKLT